MSDVLEIRVKKSHVAILSVIVLVASASAAVNIRDPMNVFGDINMKESGEDGESNAINMQNNPINNPRDIRFSGEGTVTKRVDIDNDGDYDFDDVIELASRNLGEDQSNGLDFDRDGDKDFDDVISLAYAQGTQISFDPSTGEAEFPKYNSLGRFGSLSQALSWYDLNFDGSSVEEVGIRIGWTCSRTASPDSPPQRTHKTQPPKTT